MRTPLEVIADYGVSTTSYIRAIQEFNDPERPISLNKEQYEQSIAEIVGSDQAPSYANEKEARIYFLYAVQETIRAFSSGVPDMEDVWIAAQQRADKMIKSYPWATKDYSQEGSDEPKLDSEGNPKKRKGAKKYEAEVLYKRMNDGTNGRSAIIEALVNDVGLSKAGATTYFHNLKKQFGFEGPAEERKKRTKKPQSNTPHTKKKATKRKGPTKAQVAKEVYIDLKSQPKDVVINAIMERANTSKAGANTYYCSCKKNLGHNGMIANEKIRPESHTDPKD